MIHLCIPSRNEERTIGVLLWKIRGTMLEMGRDYRVYVLNDGSTDGTAALLDRYRRAMPLAVLSEPRRVGYGAALEKLLRVAAKSTRYPKRDAIVTMQGDYTEDPGHLKALIRAFEGGADIVVGRTDDDAPFRPVRLARRLCSLALGRSAVAKHEGDPLRGFRAHRVVVVRKALRAAGSRPLVSADGWAANVELLQRLAPFARRVAAVPVGMRYDLRRRPSRVRVLRTVLDVLRARRVAPLALALSALTTSLSAAPSAARAQDSLDPEAATPVCPAGPVRPPFAPGEDMRFKVKFGIFSVGEASMTVVGVDTVHQAPTFAVQQRIRGGVLGYDIDTRFSSWIDARALLSRRFVKDQRAQERYREYEFFPEELRVRRIDHDTTWALPHPMPLDDLSFVYFARALPLETGKTYSLPRFYKDEGNPVVLKVLRRDRRKVGAGEFPTIVVEPLIRTQGLFSEGGKAEIHFSDDDRRLVVYMKIAIPVIPGDMTMHLEEFAEGDAPGADVEICPVGASA